MAYKKYIKKDGKIYGPYLYHSKRIDGKVVSEYHGSGKLNYKKFLFIFLGVFLLATFVYMINSFERGITGHAILDLSADYQEGQPLDGKIEILLDEGEALPLSSKIVFENQGNVVEYDVVDFVAAENLSKEIYPVVFFKLNILSQQEESEENATEENSTGANETAEESIESQTAPITGNTISNFFGRLTGTGNAVVEFVTEIEGEVSATENFTYTLNEGERVELKPRSAKTRLKQLPDSTLEILVEGNQIFVTTDYSEAERDLKEITIELLELGLVFEKGDLEVSIVDQGEVISSMTAVLGEEEVVQSPEPETEIPAATPQPPTLDETNETIEEETVEEIIIPETLELTVEERAALLEEFGNITVEITEASSRNGFIIIRYELGDFWVENSYSEILSNETLERFMEQDRIKWLKDIVKSISQEEQTGTELEGFLGNVSF